jgi:hypothetical protein
MGKQLCKPTPQRTINPFLTKVTPCSLQNSLLEGDGHSDPDTECHNQKRAKRNANNEITRRPFLHDLICVSDDGYESNDPETGNTFALVEMLTRKRFGTKTMNWM